MAAPLKRARLLKNLLLLLLQFLSLRPPVHNFEHLRLFRDFRLALSSSSLPREGRGRGYRRAHLSSSSFPLLPSPVAPSHRPNGGTPANFEGVRVRRKRKRKRPASEVGEKRRAASLLLFPLFLAGRPKTYRPTVRWECARGKKKEAAEEEEEAEAEGEPRVRTQQQRRWTTKMLFARKEKGGGSEGRKKVTTLRYGGGADGRKKER